MAKYRKKVEPLFDAAQWDGTKYTTVAGWNVSPSHVDTDLDFDCRACGKPCPSHGQIDIGEDWNPKRRRLCPGDWIVSGMGTVSILKTDIFGATYEKVEE